MNSDTLVPFSRGFYLDWIRFLEESDRDLGRTDLKYYPPDPLFFEISQLEAKISQQLYDLWLISKDLEPLLLEYEEELSSVDFLSSAPISDADIERCFRRFRSDHDFLSLVASKSNLFSAIKECLASNAKAGTAGVDGLNKLSIREVLNFWPQGPQTRRSRKRLSDDQYASFMRLIKEFRTALLSHSYQFSPVKRVMIPKPGKPGQFRPLGIPTIKDRIISVAINRAFVRMFDNYSSPTSYGFRPGSNCHLAIDRLQIALERINGTQTVVALDIKGYYDNIPQGGLKRVLAYLTRSAQKSGLQPITLFKSLLNRPVILDGETLPETGIGVPQGDPFSPALSNLWGHFVDHYLYRKKLVSIRYADDITVVYPDIRSLKRELPQLTDWLKSKLGLTVSIPKTVVFSGNNPSRILGLQVTPANGSIFVSDAILAKILKLIKILKHMNPHGSKVDLVASK